MNLLKKFLQINQNICSAIEKILPQADLDITKAYSVFVSDYANKQKNQTIVDIGGGRLTPYTKNLNPKLKHHLIVIDENKGELAKNTEASEIIVADVNTALPLKNNSINAITSRYVFEHLYNLPNFLLNSKKALKKDGYSIHLFSCKFALFALLNQILPQQLTKWLLNNLVPGSKHTRGFKTNYNYCYYSSIINIFSSAGYKIEKLNLSYYQSRYFSFFVPFYIISVIFEFILYSFGLKNLCAYILIVARKNGD